MALKQWLTKHRQAARANRVLGMYNVFYLIVLHYIQWILKHNKHLNMLQQKITETDNWQRFRFFINCPSLVKGTRISNTCVLPAPKGFFPPIHLDLLGHDAWKKFQTTIFSQMVGFWWWFTLTLPETNIAPKNGWLEYYFRIGEAYFQVLC